MRPVTVDMLRAHLLVASLTAAGAQAVLCIALLLEPVPEQFFASAPFRLLAIVVMIGGVIATREFAHAAFQIAVKRRHTMSGASAVQVAPDCPRRWLVILHLRLTGRPFVLAAH